MVGEFRTKVTRAAMGTTSVRTTIPEAVAALLDAQPGAVMVWRVEPGTGRILVTSEPDAK